MTKNIKTSFQLTNILFTFTFFALVMSTTARNAVMWYFHLFREASADFWQALWDRFLDTVGDDPFTLWMYASVLTPLTVYLIVATICTVMDITSKPEFLRKYKIQTGINEPVEIDQLIKPIVVVTINLTVVSFLVSYATYYVMEWRGYPPIQMLPTFYRIIADHCILAIVNEIGFYYSHRILHHKIFYKHIHKMHHQWTAPIGITALYVHPIEHIFSNILPLALSAILAGPHISVAFIWFSSAVYISVLNHCGYSFPFYPNTEFHDYHHFKFNKNFGALGLLDMLHGTYASTPTIAAPARLFRALLPMRMHTDSSLKHK